MINQSFNMLLSLSLSLSLIYHHQLTITKSTHMDTKTITKMCIKPYAIKHMSTMCQNLYHIINQPYTSTKYHNLYHTMHINHVPEPVPYNQLHQPCTKTCIIPCISTMYQNLYHIMHVLKYTINHVL
jgi:hypothetical protein